MQWMIVNNSNKKNPGNNYCECNYKTYSVLIMDEKNPLQISPTQSSASNDTVLNRGGRPATGNVIKFGPQPRSMIALMLAGMKTKDVVIEDEPTSQNDQSQDFIEAIKTEDHVCQTCFHRSCSIAEHKKHVFSHQQLLCDYPNCSYSCTLSSNLIKHKRVHTNEKPYLCDRCSFRTNFVNSLKAHKRIHTAEKPYQCEYCSYKCNSSSNLKKHRHLRHPDGNRCKYK